MVPMGSMARASLENGSRRSSVWSGSPYAKGDRLCLCLGLAKRACAGISGVGQLRPLVGGQMFEHQIDRLGRIGGADGLGDLLGGLRRRGQGIDDLALQVENRRGRLLAGLD